jgi:D-xylose transport system substrate-binding protein
MDAMFLKAVPVTRANLDVVVKAGHISKDELCKGVDKASGPAACK